MGLSYELMPYRINSNEIFTFGINFGVSFPVYGIRQSPRYLNIGFSAGQRGVLSQDLIRERYLKTTISITVNSKWFVKQKQGL